MHSDLVAILACPDCRSGLTLSGPGDAPVVWDGELICALCSRRYPIVRGIPRFVPSSGYAASFGFQWNLFRTDQLDTLNGTTLSRDRFVSETGWTEDPLRGARVLDGGCGAGRFLEIATRWAARVVGVDLSDAVDAAATSLADRANLDLIQASVDRLPFRPGVFDAVYCIGVIQHTSDPERSLRSLAGAVRSGGRIAVTIYERRWWTPLKGKYLLRHVTRRMSDRALYRAIATLLPILFPLTEVLFRLPFAGRVFRSAIPIANYVHLPYSFRQRYRWALLDTFDMLAPAYDLPQRSEDVTRWLADEGIREIRRQSRLGLNLVGVKP